MMTTTSSPSPVSSAATDSRLLAAEDVRTAFGEGSKAARNWVLAADEGSMGRTVGVENWAAAMRFLTALSDAAERCGHLPNAVALLERGRRVTVTLTTEGGLTRRDFVLAEAIDAFDVDEFWPKKDHGGTAEEEVVEVVEEEEKENEAPASFDAAHYPRGLNGDFLDVASSSADVLNKYAGGSYGEGLFEDPERRDIARARGSIVAMLERRAGLREGAVVADVGAGTGLLIEPVATVTGPSGKVIATDLSPHFRRLLEDRFPRGGPYGNVTVAAATTCDPGLDETTKCDLILLIDVYHHLEYPRTVLRRARDALKRNGVLVVVDFHRDPINRTNSRGEAWMMSHIRADQSTFRSEIEGTGFLLVDEPHVEGLPENYVMLFKKIPNLDGRPGHGWADQAKTTTTA